MSVETMVNDSEEQIADPEGPSYWSGIDQSKLNQNNRLHIEVLCEGFGTGPWNMRTNWKMVEFGKYCTVFVVERPGLATIDRGQLTRLVFAAHDACVRVQIAPKTFNHLEIMMHTRYEREGSTMTKHPTIEQALANWRRSKRRVRLPVSRGKKIRGLFTRLLNKHR